MVVELGVGSVHNKEETEKRYRGEKRNPASREEKRNPTLPTEKRKETLPCSREKKLPYPGGGNMPSPKEKRLAGDCHAQLSCAEETENAVPEREEDAMCYTYGEQPRKAGKATAKAIS